MNDSETEVKRLRMRRCECGICDEVFTDDTVVGMAKSIAKHWNDEHGDELAMDMQPFKTEEYQGHHLHGNEYSYRVYEYYVTAYDVLDTSGYTTGPFAYQYVKEPEAEDHCEDCWQSIKAVDGYRELSTDGWRDKYLCDECAHERKVERRQSENRQLTEWCA